MDRASLGFSRQLFRGPKTAITSGKKQPVSFATGWDNTPATAQRSAATSNQSKKGDRFLTENLASEESGMAEEEALLEGMMAVNADIILPLKSTDELVGLLCCAMSG